MLTEDILNGLSTDNGKFRRDFEKAKKIARGGFATVYKAQYRVDQQIYAIKKIVLRVSLHDASKVQEELLRVLKEVRLFASINDSHIIRYNHSWLEVAEIKAEKEEKTTVSKDPESPVELDSPFICFERAENSTSSNSRSDCDSPLERNQNSINNKQTLKIRLYIQMELCKQTLEDYLVELNSTYPDLQDKEGYVIKIDIAYQILQALYTIHQEHKLIHRDLSLKNIFIGNDAIVKIGDFGLATKTATRTHEIPKGTLLSFKLDEDSEVDDGLTHGLGTLTFSSPEQLSDLPYDQTSDIYSLGLIFLALFYPTTTISERLEVIGQCKRKGPPSDLTESYPDIADLIRRMMSLDPKARPSVIELLGSKLFHNEHRSTRSYSTPSPQECANTEILTRVGTEGKWKPKYIRIGKDNMLAYKGKYDTKAKFCYSFKDCKLSLIPDTEHKAGKSVAESIKEETKGDIMVRRHQSLDPMWQMKGATKTLVFKVEHKELETLYLKIETEEQAKLVEIIKFANSVSDLTTTH